MKILFDARWTKTDRHDGISRFGSSLVEALARLDDITMLIHDPRQLDLLPSDIPYMLVNHPLEPRELLLPRLLDRLGADVVYSPMQIMGTHGRRYKLILTLHDTIYYTFPTPPSYLPAFQRAGWWLFHQANWPGRLVLNLADVVATVSETSKSEILARHLTDRPVEVIYNAPPALGGPGSQTGLERELVYMGSLMPYKNVEALIRAMRMLPDYLLHLTGRDSASRLDELRALAREIGVLERVRFWNGASDAEYATILSTAMASVSASKAEGFGLPVIEAMSSGVPFIGTDMPIFREVAGDAALFFDPDSPADIAACVRKVEDPDFRAGMIERGRKQAARFSWERSAARLHEVMTALVCDAPAGAARDARHHVPARKDQSEE